MKKDDKLEKLKKEMWKEYWVEGRHDFLKGLPQDEAKEVVDSFDDDEVYANVNIRKFQQDYICDYLEYLWELSPIAFWKHLESSLEYDKIGPLIGDNNVHFEIMGSEDLPMSIWKKVLNWYPKLEDYLEEEFGRIIFYQTMNASQKEEKRKYFIEWFLKVPDDFSKTVLTKVQKVFGAKPPQWLCDGMKL